MRIEVNGDPTPNKGVKSLCLQRVLTPFLGSVFCCRFLCVARENFVRRGVLAEAILFLYLALQRGEGPSWLAGI